MPRQRTIWRICEYCWREFLTDAREVNRGGSRFCSKSCAGRSHALPLADRLWPRVIRNNTAGACWLWTGPTIPRGYGVLGGHQYAHRAAWELASGSPPPHGHFVLHTCDAPACVRNDEPGVYLVDGIALPRFGHLFLGTHAQNMLDMIAKGRSQVGDRNVSRTHRESVQRGTEHWSQRMPERISRGEQKREAKLTDAQVIEIRARYAADGVWMKTLAAEYGVTQGNIQAIVRRKTWRHLP